MRGWRNGGCDNDHFVFLVANSSDSDSFHLV